MPLAGATFIDTLTSDLHIGDYGAVVVHWWFEEGGSVPFVDGMTLIGSVSIPVEFGTSGADVYAAVATVAGDRFDQGWIVIPPDPPEHSSYAPYWLGAGGGWFEGELTWEAHITPVVAGGSTADSITIPNEGYGCVMHFLFGEENYDSLMYTIFDEDSNEYSGAPVNFVGTWALGVGEDFVLGVGDSHSISTDYPATASLSFGFYPDGPSDHIGTPGSPSCPLRWEGS